MIFFVSWHYGLVCIWTLHSIATGRPMALSSSDLRADLVELTSLSPGTVRL